MPSRLATSAALVLGSAIAAMAIFKVSIVIFRVLPADLLVILKIMIYVEHHQLHGPHFVDLSQFAFKSSPTKRDWISFI
jgi:hypothetical protein